MAFSHSFLPAISAMSASLTAPSPKDAKGEKFLRKAEREACWKARDDFWDCFRANNEVVAKCTATR